MAYGFGLQKAGNRRIVGLSPEHLPGSSANKILYGRPCLQGPGLRRGARRVWHEFQPEDSALPLRRYTFEGLRLYFSYKVLPHGPCRLSIVGLCSGPHFGLREVPAWLGRLGMVPSTGQLLPLLRGQRMLLRWQNHQLCQNVRCRAVRLGPGCYFRITPPIVRMA